MDGDGKTLKRLAKELEVWRGQNSPSKAFPARIWSEAAQLAQRLGVSSVSKALKLDYSKLRSLAVKGPNQPVPCSVSTTAFVELLPQSSHALGDCALEFESPQGFRLRIQIANATSSGLASLIRELVA
jgi:hypothetical protein